MTYRNIIFKILCIACIILLVQCKGEENLGKSNLTGTINCSTKGGFRLELESATNSDNTSVAFSDSKGKFGFYDVDPGFYYLNASKNGFRWVITSFDDRSRDPIHTGSTNKQFELEAGKTTAVTVTMSGDGSGDYDGRCDILDMDGNPISELPIKKNADQIAFQIFNGTDQSHRWDVRDNQCVSTDGMFCTAYWFTSIDNQSGELDAGKVVTVVCHINTQIYECQDYGSCNLRVSVGGWFEKTLYLHY